MKARYAFAIEWRSVPYPDIGKTYNPGDGNRANDTTEAVREALINARKKVMSKKITAKIKSLGHALSASGAPSGF